MNNQNQESITNSEASYSSDFNPNNNNHLEEDDEIHEQGDSNNRQNTKTYLITIQIHPEERQAILSIGIRNAPPVIQTIDYQEITSQPTIKDCIRELEEILPKIIETAEKAINTSQTRQVQQRELPKDYQKVESNKKQLSLF
ncbi:hypothetical protein [Brasilonema sp. UFV-L1]|uniref:hypothetical protein n=1 Tax=Brasilonema sp. UFV-L1 TaxID=2234130 RepID=UPI00145ED021|nr:hypothetical protein [Brasilonema sp. UFV-L1]NMG10603.1 hypothetical protein [Brasilonema sp. UFV-L1]